MLRARCRSICAMALRKMRIGSRVSRQCSLTIRPSTRWILEDRRIVHPQDPSGQTQLMNSYWLPSKRTKGLTARPKLVQVSCKVGTWYASGSILYFGSLYGTRKISKYGTSKVSNGRPTCWLGISARPESRSLLLWKMWRWRCWAPAWRSVVVEDQSRPDSGLVQNCPALSTADSALTRPNGFLTGKLPPADR
jgi:hypothetical protein